MRNHMMTPSSGIGSLDGRSDPTIPPDCPEWHPAFAVEFLELQLVEIRDS